MIDNPACNGVYNLVAPQQVTNHQFVKILGKVMHRPSVMPMPAFALRVLFGEMSIIVLEGQNLSVEKLLKAGFTFQFPNLEPALLNLLKG